MGSDSYSINARGFVLDSDDRILLLRHRPSQKWVLPGGHSNAHEAPHDTFVREIKEEVNLDIQLLGETIQTHDRSLAPYPTPIANYLITYTSPERGTICKFEFVFVARVTGGQLKLQEEEVCDAKWVSYDELLSLDTSSIHEHIQSCAQKIKPLFR